MRDGNSEGSSKSEIIHFNIGGQYFSTYRATLTKKIRKNNIVINMNSAFNNLAISSSKTAGINNVSSCSSCSTSSSDTAITNDTDDDEYFKPNLLEQMINGRVQVDFDDRNAVFIDRNPKYFNYIIDFLRMVNTDEIYEIPINPKILDELYREADYFQLDPLKCQISPFYESKILSLSHVKSLIESCGFRQSKRWKLLYRASDDGFDAADFHRKCDGKFKTLTVVKSTTSNIFGGYAEETWNHSSQAKADPNAFMFSFASTTDPSSSFKIINNGSSHDIFCSASSMPCFGNGVNNDLYLSSGSNKNLKSYCKIGYSYLIPFRPHLKSVDNQERFLAGSYNFQVEDIEIFTKVA